MCKIFIPLVAREKGRVNHRVRMAVLDGQRDRICCIGCAEEDGQCELGMFANKNLIVVVSEWSRNSANPNDTYFASASFLLYIVNKFLVRHQKEKPDLKKIKEKKKKEKEKKNKTKKKKQDKTNNNYNNVIYKSVAARKIRLTRRFNLFIE